MAAAFLILILILSFSAIFIYKVNMEKMQEQLIEYDIAIVENFANSLNESINELHRTFHSIYSMDYDIFNDATGRVNFYEAKLAIEDISFIKKYSDRIFDIIIYSKNHPELFFTTNGSYSNLNVFEFLYNNPMYSPSFWSNYKADQNITIFPSCEFKNILKSKNEMGTYLIPAISSRPEQKRNFNVVIFIDTEKIFRIQAQKEYLEKSGFAVFDSSKSIIMSKNLKKNELNSLKNFTGLISSEGSFEINNNEYFFIKTLFNLTVVNKLSDVSILSTTKYINIFVIVLSVITCFAVSFIAVFLFYKPIKNVLMVISKKETSNYYYNEFEIIGSEIKNLKYQTVSLANTINTLKDVNIRSVFHKAINGIETTMEDLEMMFSAVIKNDENITFYIIVTADLINDFEATDKSNFENYNRYSCINLRAIWQKHLPYSIIYEFEYHRFVSLVLLKINITKEALGKILKNLMSDFEKEFKDSTLCLSVSNIYSNLLDIKKAYEETLACIRFKSITCQNAIMYYNEMFKLQNQYMPFDLIEKLKSNIMIGNAQECLNIINVIISKNVELEIDFFTFKNLCYHLLRIIYQVIPESLIKALDKSYHFINSTTQLYSFSDTSEYSTFFKTLIIVLTKIICEETNKDTISSREKINYIKEYIMLHYNEDLYLDNLSAMVNLAPKYFSRHFKEITHVSLTEYLNQIRIFHAKDFLKNSEFTLNEIALMVGYRSNSALTSNFIKYVGMSPAKYRSMITG